ncbi:hypothetical protein L6452_01310 [Arctium lappa]|uniref:Uncharacterized protein n=1 Tax=Arctium lappa TaxID=4217 RepID=A0ACB9FHL5_ARCLA|nr:hypothetical protein L6452_01310 [Arctium lappa]
MDADIDLSGLGLFGEDMGDAEIDLDGAEIDLNDINMDGNQQDNHERTTMVPGLEAKTRFSILGTDWRKFDQADKERMWTAIKGATLKIACTAWKNFKKILKANYMEKNRSPCAEFNFIDDKT